MLLTAKSGSQGRKTYVYIQNFLLEHNWPKITMDSDSPFVITYMVIWPMCIVLRKKNFQKFVYVAEGGKGLKIDFFFQK